MDDQTEGKLTYRQQDPKKFNGMESWGKTFELLTETDKEVESLSVGFTLEESDAARVVSCWNACESLKDPSVLTELLSDLEEMIQWFNASYGYDIKAYEQCQKVSKKLAAARGESKT